MTVSSRVSYALRSKLQVICQSNCQRNDCQSRIDAAGGRKDGTARDKKIVDFVYATITVNDPLPWIVVHAGRAYVMATGDDGYLVPCGDTHTPKVRCSYASRERHRHLIQTVIVFSGNSPV
jgi:hypothetical protein